MKKIVLLTFLILCGCATPQTFLKNNNGDVVTCGGSSTDSIFGGMIGYSIQKNNDDKCVHNYMEQGYKPVRINGIDVNDWNKSSDKDNK